MIMHFEMINSYVCADVALLCVYFDLIDSHQYADATLFCVQFIVSSGPWHIIVEITVSLVQWCIVA